MLSRLFSLIALLFAGIAILLYIFSDDLIKKGEEGLSQVQKSVQDSIEQKKDMGSEVMQEMHNTLQKAEEAVQENIQQ